MSLASTRRPRRLILPGEGLSIELPPRGAEPAAAPAGPRPDWTAWRRHLAERSEPAPLATVFGGKSAALLWGLPGAIGEPSNEESGPAPRELLIKLAKVEKGNAPRRLLTELWPLAPRQPVLEPSSDREALLLVAWARAADVLALVTDREDWWNFFDGLIQIVRRADGDDAHRLRQILRGELALTLAYLFPGIPTAAQAADSAWQNLERSLQERVAESGLLADADTGDWLPLFACWTRSRLLGEAAGRRLNAAALQGYKRLSVGLLRLARPDGSLVLSGAPTPRAHAYPDLWRAADGFVDLASGGIMPDGLRAGRRSTARAKLPEASPAIHCEAAELAVLRPSWSGPRLVVDYGQAQVRVELDRGGEAIVSGLCNPRVSLDGKRLGQDSTWEATCWISDEDVDYLELRLSLTDDVRIERHLVLAREDEFLFMADAVLGQQPGAIDYQTPLPLPAAASVQADDETREITLLVGGRRQARVLPLALSEWRGEGRRGELRAADGGLRLTQSAANASSLFVPWFIDLAPRRLRRPVTWRQLTIAEDRRIQADDAAVGYRVQIGNQQWLFYRSLAARGNRTVLGHNLVSEFLAARFSRQGLTETLIEIEGPADQDE